MTIEVIGGIVVFAIIVIVVIVQGVLEDKKANNGNDKEILDQIVREKIEGSGNFTSVFADWDEKKYSGSGSRIKVQTTTWNYIMCFNHTEVKLIPLRIGENTINGGDLINLSVDNLSLVNGKSGQTWVSFYDKNGEEIATVFVPPEPRKSDEKPVNLSQQNEYEKFLEWLPVFMDTINTANGTTPTHKILKK